MQKLLQGWLHALGLDQHRCAFCLRPFEPQHPAPSMEFLAADKLCPDCRAQLAPRAIHVCQRCALPLEGAHAAICGRCTLEPPPWDAIAVWGLYRAALRAALLRFKFDGELSLAPVLTGFLLQAAACLPRPDALLAVPQHPNHLRARGFNQAHELTRELQRVSGLCLRPQLLQKVRHTTTQAGLTARDRASNLRGSFAAHPDVRGLRLWLVDDVMTTGSTLREACRCLRNAGAASLCVLVVARTPRQDTSAPLDKPEERPCKNVPGAGTRLSLSSEAQ